MLLTLGYAGRSPSIWMWAGAPLVLFSAAFFGERTTRILALAAGTVAWLVISAREVEMFRRSLPEFGGVPLISALESKVPSIILLSMALLAPPALGAVLRVRLRRTQRPYVVKPVSQTLADYASSVSLTTREQRVFELAAQGLTNAEIAAAEHVSEATVKSQMTRVLAKVGARDRVQLAIEAHRRGLFDVVG